MELPFTEGEIRFVLAENRRHCRTTFSRNLIFVAQVALCTFIDRDPVVTFALEISLSNYQPEQARGGPTKSRSDPQIARNRYQ